ncbi:MAG: histidine phosphatase family protein [Actinomycetota bacterium]|nr:histidine phosphatase family protein [Actinomycetota bacterium]
MRLILIRHGQTPSNVLGLLDTAVPGPRLTDLGSEQAAAIVEALAGEHVDAIVASPQTRAQLTATPLATARGLPIAVLDGLREVSAGAWEMSGTDEAVDGYIGVLGEWMHGRLDAAMPGGESGGAVLKRYDEAIAEAFDQAPGTVVAVSHGAVIRLWAGIRAANLPDDFGAGRPVSNTGVIVLVRADSNQPWQGESWTGDAIGGVELDDASGDGPAADPLGRLADPTGG